MPPHVSSKHHLLNTELSDLRIIICLRKSEVTVTVEKIQFVMSNY